MIFYCHRCYMYGDWVEDITGEDYLEAVYISEGEFGFGDVVYVGFQHYLNNQQQKGQYYVMER